MYQNTVHRSNIRSSEILEIFSSINLAIFSKILRESRVSCTKNLYIFKKLRFEMVPRLFLKTNHFAYPKKIEIVYPYITILYNKNNLEYRLILQIYFELCSSSSVRYMRSNINK